MPDRIAVRGGIFALVLSLVTLLLGAAQPVAAAEPAGFEYFHTYAEMEAAIDNVVADHPNLARKFSIGKSYEGRQIWAVKLTTDVDGSTKGKPEVLINALMHARERASAEMAIFMMRVLANNYGLSGKLGKKVTKILNTTVVYIIPMMNPDGAEYDFSGGKFHRWRKNRQPTPNPKHIGIDLNRQFGFTWNCCGGSSGKPKSDNYRGWAAEVAPEVQAYQDFIKSRKINGTQRITEILSLHSAAKRVLWPYSYTKANVPSTMTKDDHKAFVALGKGMAKRNGYRAEQGSDMYIVDGDQDDWAYHAQGIFALTLEMKKGKQKRYYPTQKELNKDLDRNMNAVLWFLKKAGCPYKPAGLDGKYCGSSASSEFYSQSVYDESRVQPQQTNCWCAVASTRALLKHIDPSIAVSQTDLNAYMTPRDKNDWTNPAFDGYLRCTKGSPSPSYAHDGRGMAWALWNYASPDQSLGYNDYRSTNRGDMNWSIVRGIRATGQPVGVIVAGGAHAILAVGYQTAVDPLDDIGRSNSILGIRVWDPWYAAGFGNWSGWPNGGFAGNSYIAIDTWNSSYFKRDVQEGPFYDGYYVAVLRSSVAEQPKNSPAMSYGDWLHAQLDGTLSPDPEPEPTPTPSPTPSEEPSPPPSEEPTAEPSRASTSAAQVNVVRVSSPTYTTTTPSAADIGQAVRVGLEAHGLFGDPSLGDVPPTFSIGNSLHVTSLDADVPSYHLVELVVGGRVRAVALVNETAAGYRFGELRATLGDVRLPTQSALQAALGERGLRGTASLSWTWLEDQPAPPFAPFLTGVDRSGHKAFVTPMGVDATLDSVN